MPGFDIIMAQVNTVVGDFDGNVAQVLDTVARVEASTGPAVVVFPELTLCGYPPEDLLLRPSMERRVQAAIGALCDAVVESHVVIGYPGMRGGRLYNMAAVIHRGEVVAEYAKQCLPNYQVFDEKRYFHAGSSACIVDIHGVPVALTVCEDIWEPEPLTQRTSQGCPVSGSVSETLADVLPPP